MKAKQNISNLTKIFKNDTNPKAALALKLLDEIKFMNAVLKELRIKAGSGDAEALRKYNVTVNNYRATMKLLNDMLPNDVEKEPEDEFEL